MSWGFAIVGGCLGTGVVETLRDTQRPRRLAGRSHRPGQSNRRRGLEGELIDDTLSFATISAAIESTHRLQHRGSPSLQFSRRFTRNHHHFSIRKSSTGSDMDSNNLTKSIYHLGTTCGLYHTNTDRPITHPIALLWMCVNGKATRKCDMTDGYWFQNSLCGGQPSSVGTVCTL